MNPMKPRSSPSTEVTIQPLREGAFVAPLLDRVVTEEPLEIRVLLSEDGTPRRHSLSVTMRTPGNDDELAVGFLVTEGALQTRDQLAQVAACGDVPPEAAGNVINLHLAPGTPFDTQRFTRNVYTTSSCGVCGKTSLEMVKVTCPHPPRGTFTLGPEAWSALASALDRPEFRETGGIHTAALFSREGTLLHLRDDVGRHNAVDKVVGRLFLDEQLPADDTVLLLSGRAGFELVQKAAVAGIPAVAAIGAPSSLAVELAREMGMTLVGFLREGRFNVYSGEERVEGLSTTR
jgi:FdhD protein